MTSSAQADYLKKYLSKDDGRKKKKKKDKEKPKFVSTGMRIVEDDAFARVDANFKDDDDSEEDFEEKVIQEHKRKLAKGPKFKSAFVEATPTTVSGSPSSRQRHDSDNSPERTEKAVRTRHDSDSPPRKQVRISLPRKRHDSDESPPRRRQRHDSDSPPRNTRTRHDSDESPPRRRQRHDSESPPRQQKNRTRHDSDTSPPRRKRHDSGSPPRSKQRTRHDSDESPPRRRQRHDSDNSPPRRSSNRKSPDRKSQSTRKRHDSDNSPPRKKTRGGSDSDVSPPRRRVKQESPDQSPARRGRDENHSPKRRRISSPEVKPQKTLDGKMAGLQSARDLKKETEKLKERENRMFEEMDRSTSGRGADTVVREKQIKKNRDKPEDKEKKEREAKKQAELQEKYKDWNKGVQQIQDRKEKLEEMARVVAEPLARRADDDAMNEHLKKQMYKEDPLAALISNNKREKAIDRGEDVYPTYDRPFPPNRFGIRPGYRWDGVDRSNGFEGKLSLAQNSRSADTTNFYENMGLYE